MSSFEKKKCIFCSKLWLPKNRYQSKRNLFCSKECRSNNLSNKYKGKSNIKDLEKECIKCKQIKVKIPKLAYLDGKIVYFDENNKRWNGNTCRDCRIKKEKKGRNLDYYTHKKGYESEKIAKKYFEYIGFRVVRPDNIWGVDLILDNKIYVEVRSVVTVRGKYYYIPPIKGKRRDDDIIAIVLPNKKILIEDMKSHLIQCSKSGARYLTNIVREYL